MLLRRAAAAAGLAFVLVGASAGTAFADDGSLLDGATNMTEEVAPSQVEDLMEGAQIPTAGEDEGLTSLLSDESGGGTLPIVGGNDGTTLPVVGGDDGTTLPAAGGEGGDDGLLGVLGGDNGDTVQVPTQEGDGLGGEDALIGDSDEFICVDVASESDPPPCESDLLGNELLNACLGGNEGETSLIGMSGESEGLGSLGLECQQAEGAPMPPPGEDGGPGEGGGPGGDFMPSPEDMARAAPAGAVEAEPTFAG